MTSASLAERLTQSRLTTRLTFLIARWWVWFRVFDGPDIKKKYSFKWSGPEHYFSAQRGSTVGFLLPQCGLTPQRSGVSATVF